MGAKVSIQDQVFQMKMSSKKLEKSAQKALKQEAATKKKVRAFVLDPFPTRRQFQSVEEQLPQARTRGTLPHAAALPPFVPLCVLSLSMPFSQWRAVASPYCSCLLPFSHARDAPAAFASRLH